VAIVVAGLTVFMGMVVFGEFCLMCATSKFLSQNQILAYCTHMQQLICSQNESIGFSCIERFEVVRPLIEELCTNCHLIKLRLHVQPLSSSSNALDIMMKIGFAGVTCIATVEKLM
jgi:hypothetical protein